jgi:hypothetical protein
LLFCKQVHPIISQNQNQNQISNINCANRRISILLLSHLQYCIDHRGGLPLLTCHTAQYFPRLLPSSLPSHVHDRCADNLPTPIHRPCKSRVLIWSPSLRIVWKDWKKSCVISAPSALVIFFGFPFLSVPTGLPCAHTLHRK